MVLAQPISARSISPSDPVIPAGTPIQVEIIGLDPLPSIAPRRGRPPAIKRSPTSPDLFPPSATRRATAEVTHRMASNRVIWEGCNILSQGRSLAWVETESGVLSYQSPVAQGKGYISFALTQEAQLHAPNLLSGEMALALIEKFDLRAACLHLIYAAFATQLERPWEQQFVVSDRQLERYLGLDKNKKLNKQQKLTLLLELAKQPCSLVVYVSWPDRGKVKSFTVSRTLLWEIAEPMLHFQEDIEGRSELIGFTLQVRAGNWAQYFLNADRCQDATGYYEYSILSPALLQDVMSLWYNHEGAARLMLWLLFKTRVSNDPVRASTLLKVAFGAEKIAAARSDSFARKRLVKQWKTTLKVLSERGWKLTFDAVTYPTQYLPDLPELAPFSQIPDDPDAAAEFWLQDAQRDEGDRLTDLTRKPYGGFEQLLNAHVLIQPPSAIALKLEEIKKHRGNAVENPSENYSVTPERKPIAKKRSKSKASPETLQIQSGEQLKELRIARGMTQGILAEKIGKSTSWVKLVETGRRNITEGDRQLLNQLFAQQEG